MEYFETYADGGLVGIHELARVLHWASTGEDIWIARQALILQRSSSHDELYAFINHLAGSDNSTDRALLAALTTERSITGEQVAYWEHEAGKWEQAIHRAAKAENWPLFDLNNLAPITTEDDGVSGYLVSLQTVIDWLASIGGAPTLAGTLFCMFEASRLRHDQSIPHDASLDLLHQVDSNESSGKSSIAETIRKRYQELKASNCKSIIKTLAVEVSRSESTIKKHLYGKRAKAK